MNRLEFMTRLMLSPSLEIRKMRQVDITLLLNDVMNSFEKKEGLLISTARQTGRTTAIFLNLLYEVYIDDCVETIVVGRSVEEVKRLFQYQFKMLDCNSFITPEFINNKFSKNITIMSMSKVADIDDFSRKGKRLVLLEAAHLKDKLDKVVYGWDMLVMEAIPPIEETYNKKFIRERFINSNVLGINVLKYTYAEIVPERKLTDFNISWLERLKIRNPNLYKCEIEVNWVQE